MDYIKPAEVAAAIEGLNAAPAEVAAARDGLDAAPATIDGAEHRGWPPTIRFSDKEPLR